MKYKLQLLIFFAGLNMHAQTTKLNLDSCVILSRNNYPLINQLNVLSEIEKLQKTNLNSNWLPSISGNAQASIQSDVTALNIPAIPGFPTIIPPNKDQYKFYLEAGQLIYDGGTLQHQRHLYTYQTKADQLRVESELYKIKDKTIQVFFNTLQLQEQMNVLNLTKKDLEALLQKTNVAYEAQVVSGYQLNSVKAEIIKLEQKILELQSQKNSLLNILARLIGKNISNNTQLEIPDAKINQTVINRPEYKLLELQDRILSEQKILVGKKSIPKISAFAQAGYANPALNFLKNQFDWYYIAGIKLNWNITSWYTTHREQKITLLNKNISNLQKESFIYGQELQQIQLTEDAKKYIALQTSDKNLIDLRTKIKIASKLQYDNGTLTISDYLKDLNAEEQAKINLEIHKLQYIQTIYQSNHINGN